MSNAVVADTIEDLRCLPIAQRERIALELLADVWSASLADVLQLRTRRIPGFPNGAYVIVGGDESIRALFQQSTINNQRSLSERALKLSQKR